MGTNYTAWTNPLLSQHWRNIYNTVNPASSKLQVLNTQHFPANILSLEQETPNHFPGAFCIGTVAQQPRLKAKYLSQEWNAQSCMGNRSILLTTEEIQEC